MNMTVPSYDSTVYNASYVIPKDLPVIKPFSDGTGWQQITHHQEDILMNFIETVHSLLFLIVNAK